MGAFFRAKRLPSAFKLYTIVSLDSWVRVSNTNVNISFSLIHSRRQIKPRDISKSIFLGSACPDE